MRFILVSALLLANAWPANAAADKIDLSTQRLCPGTLVRAKVVDVAVAGGEVTAHLQIVHVYCGPQSARSAVFVVYGPKDGQSNNFSPSMFPPYQPGELQIWMIRQAADHHDQWLADPVTPHRIGRGLSLPARDGVPKTHYPEMGRWAEAVQKTIDAAESERRTLLEVFAESNIAPVRQWARDMLGLRDPVEPTTRPDPR